MNLGGAKLDFLEAGQKTSRSIFCDYYGRQSTLPLTLYWKKSALPLSPSWRRRIKKIIERVTNRSFTIRFTSLPLMTRGFGWGTKLKYFLKSTWKRNGIYFQVDGTHQTLLFII